jgi:Uncharacterized protein conserved in bacteria, prophage-related
MNLSDYLSKKRGRQAALCKLIGAHPPDMCKWASGERPIPFPYGAPIEKATKGLVTRQEMFPDEWQRLWPELSPLPKKSRASRQPPTVPP